MLSADPGDDALAWSETLDLVLARSASCAIAEEACCNRGVLLRERRDRAPRVEPVGVVQVLVLIWSAEDRIGQHRRRQRSLGHPPLREAGGGEDAVVAPPETADVGEPVERRVVVCRPPVLGGRPEAVGEECLESFVAAAGVRLGSRLVALTADDHDPPAILAAVDRTDRVGRSTLMYIPRGAELSSTAAAIAYEVVGWALAKKSPRSRNGSWVATIT